MTHGILTCAAARIENYRRPTGSWGPLEAKEIVGGLLTAEMSGSEQSDGPGHTHAHRAHPRWGRGSQVDRFTCGTARYHDT